MQQTYTNYVSEDSWFQTTYYFCNCVNLFLAHPCMICDIEGECEKHVNELKQSRHKVTSKWKQYEGKCKKCSSYLYWMKTKNDKNIPITIYLFSFVSLKLVIMNAHEIKY